MDRQSRRRCPDETGGLTVQPGDPRPRPITTLDEAASVPHRSASGQRRENESDQPPASLHVSELRHWAHKIARLSDGQYRWLMGEIRRTKKSLRTGRPVRSSHKARYVGGIRVLKRSTLHQHWSDRVRKRDKWTCQRCHRYFPEGRDRQGLDAAHIFGKGAHPSPLVKYDDENGVALCSYPCHREWAHQFLSRQQWLDWNESRMGPARFEALRVKAYRGGRR